MTKKQNKKTPPQPKIKCEKWKPGIKSRWNKQKTNIKTEDLNPITSTVTLKGNG